MVNKAILIGHLGQDPGFSATQEGDEVASFSLATSDYWKDKSGERQSKTEWHKVKTWNKGIVGVIKSYLKKGSKVYIEGTIRTRKWQDNDGKDRYTTEIMLEAFTGKLVMLDGKESKNDSQMPF